MRAAMKALNRLADGGEDVEEAIDAGGLEVKPGLWGNAREANIAVALHGFLKAAQKEMNGGEVHVAQIGAVNHDGWSQPNEVTFKVTKK